MVCACQTKKQLSAAIAERENLKEDLHAYKDSKRQVDNSWRAEREKTIKLSKVGLAKRTLEIPKRRHLYNMRRVVEMWKQFLTPLSVPRNVSNINFLV